MEKYFIRGSGSINLSTCYRKRTYKNKNIRVLGVTTHTTGNNSTTLGV